MRIQKWDLEQVKSNNSYHTILRSSSIIGGGQVVKIFFGILKMKVAAVILGPGGVGLVGLYQNLMQTGAQIVSMGLRTAGTRQIAVVAARKDAEAVRIVQRALSYGATLLSVLGVVLFWGFSPHIAKIILNDFTRAHEVAWLSIGVALLVGSMAQTALLVGFRRIGDLAWVNAGASILSAILGIGTLWMWGTKGLLPMVLITPAATFLLGHFFVARLNSAKGGRLSLRLLAREWWEMLGIGIPFMLSGLVVVLGNLAVRSMVGRELGAEALGQFEASWAIGMTYLGFVLGAMGTDYYPRLSAVIDDHRMATRLVNEQTEVALLLCAPPVVAMLGLSPWVIQLLYSAEFGPAVEIMRWQLLGDILKVMSWPLGYVILARGAGKTFVFTESTGILIFVLGSWMALPTIGVKGTGIAFLGLYLVYLPLVYAIARHFIGFHWSRAVLGQAGIVVGAALLIELAARLSPLAGGAAGTLLAIILGLWSLIRLSEKTDAGGRFARLAKVGKKLRTWILTILTR